MQHRAIRSALAGVVLLAASSAAATTVRRVAISELAARSAVIFHGVVRAVDDDLAEGPDGPFLTAVSFEVLEVVKGLPADSTSFELVLPGGRASDQTLRIPGMPVFRDGDEVVLLLERWRGGYALAGWSQGVFRVERRGAATRMRRDLEGALLLGAAATELAPDATLRDLLDYTRLHAGAGP